MLEEVIKVHTLEIQEGANVVRDNPHKVTGKELQGTCGGKPFPSDYVTIFPVGEKDAIYVYHAKGSRVEDMSDWEGAKIIGYFSSGEIELTDRTRISFNELNPKHWQGTQGHSGRIMHLHLRYDRIPDQEKRQVAKACPVSPLPNDYK